MAKTESLVNPSASISRREFLRAAGGVAAAGLIMPTYLSELLPNPEALNKGMYLPALNPGWSIDGAGQCLITGEYIERLKGLGSKVLRIEMILGPHQDWDDGILSSYAEMIANARNAGMEVSLVVDMWTVKAVSDNPSAEWNQNNIEDQGGNGRNPYMDRLVAATEAIALRLHPDRFEVWNEPAGNIVTGIHPSNMATLLTDAYTAVKKIDPEIEIVFGGDMNGLGTGYLRSVINSGYAYFGWKIPMFDSLGYHFYHPRGQYVTESEIGYHLYGLRQAIPSTMPIRITEVGWQAGDSEYGEKMQSDNLQTFYGYIDKHPNLLVAEINWFAHHDIRVGSGPIETWGLIDSTGRRRLSYDTYMKYASKIVAP